jgi:CelD/BcsL family acetyltransferase involved in cellulose biosynthesis
VPTLTPAALERTPAQAGPSRASAPAPAFRVCRGLDGLAALRPEWERLVAAMEAPRFVHKYAWHRSYLETLDEDPAAVHYFVKSVEDRVVAVLPLRRMRLKRRGIGLRAWVLPYHEILALADIVALPGQATASLWSEWAAFTRQHPEYAWDLLQLSHVLSASAATHALALDPPARLERVRDKRADYLPCVPLDTLSQSFSKNFKGNLRKARNKLQALERVRYLSTRDPAELPAFFERFLTVEASGWKGRAGTGTAIALHPRIRGFFEHLIEGFGPDRECEINLLEGPEGCLAGQFCLAVGEVLYVLKIGYDQAHAALAPGNMLLEHLLERTADEASIREINLVSGAAWHRDWHPQWHDVEEIELYNATIRGLILWNLARAKHLLKPIRQRLTQSTESGT